MPSFAFTSNEHRLAILMDHLEQDDTAKKFFWASLGYAQLVVRSGRQILSLPYKGYSHLVPEYWVKKLWQFLDTCKSTVYIPVLWIPVLQRKGNRYLMDVARASGFSVGDQIILREATTILKVHTIINITTLYGINIKKGVVEGILDDYTSCYRWPRPMEWDTNHSQVIKSLTNRITIASKRLQIHLRDFHTNIDPSNDTIVEFRPRLDDYIL